MGINSMSDWSMEEYLSSLGAIPEGKYPRAVASSSDEEEEDLTKTFRLSQFMSASDL